MKDLIIFRKYKIIFFSTKKIDLFPSYKYYKDLDAIPIKKESKIDLLNESGAIFEKVQKIYPSNTLNSTEIYRTYNYSLNELESKSKMTKTTDMIKRAHFYFNLYNIFDIKFGTHLYLDRFKFEMLNTDFPLQSSEKIKKEKENNTNDITPLHSNKIYSYRTKSQLRSNYHYNNYNNIIMNNSYGYLPSKITHTNKYKSIDNSLSRNTDFNTVDILSVVDEERKSTSEDENKNEKRNKNRENKNIEININKKTENKNDNIELLGKKRNLENIKIEKIIDDKKDLLEVDKEEKDIIRKNLSKMKKKAALLIESNKNSNKKIEIQKENINNNENKNIINSNNIKKELTGIEIPINYGKTKKVIDKINQDKISVNELLKKNRAKSVVKKVKLEKDNIFTNSRNNENINNNIQNWKENKSIGEDEKDEELITFEKDLKDFLRRTISEERKYVFFANIIPESLHVLLNLFNKTNKFKKSQLYPIFKGKKFQLSLYIEQGGKIRN